MIKTLIVDDEPRAIKTLQLLLERNCPDLQIVASSKNIHEAFEELKNHKIDLMFLDINMPQGSGIELLERISQFDLKIIMTTAHKEFAIEALRHSVLDYLLKPIDKVDLKKAIDRFYKSQIQEKVLENESNHISVNTVDGISLIKLSEILFIESDKNYSSFHLENEVITSSKSIGEYEKKLETAHFFRIHRSYLVNLKMVKMFKRGKNPYLILKNDHQLEIAKNRKDAVLEAIETI